MWFRTFRIAAPQVVLTLCLISIAGIVAHAQIRPDPEALALAPAELRDRLRSNPYDYFRFVNRVWIERVCSVFAEDLPTMPVVRLHGDAHIEQFAVSEDAWGLEDFDDSTRGPAVVDIVRLLGSIDLVARQRGWLDQRDALYTRFFDGYGTGLSNPNQPVSPPGIVRRLRAQTSRSRAGFLSWGESLMEPPTASERAAVVDGLRVFSDLVRAEKPNLSPAYFTLVRVGWLRMGIGSAVGHKILMRVEGPSTSSSDDELLEAKELSSLHTLRCLEAPATRPTIRVIVGAQQIGRLKPHILVAGPELLFPDLVINGRKLRNWWVRSWEPSYKELHLSELRSVTDLAEIVHDAGVQLGGGSLHEESHERAEFLKRETLATLAKLELRIREESTRMVEELLIGWKELASSAK